MSNRCLYALGVIGYWSLVLFCLMTGILLAFGCSPATSEVDDTFRHTNLKRTNGVLCQAYDGNIPQFAERRYYKVERLHYDQRLAANAQAHAEYVAETLDLGRLQQEHHQTHEALAEVTGAGENIAQIGPITTYQSDGTHSSVPEPDHLVGIRLVRAWIDSPGHCHNMMQSQWTRVGIGVALSPGGRHYGVQVFGR